MNPDGTPTRALAFWENGVDYRLHYEAVGLYALYPNRTLYQLSWPQVVRRVQEGCTMRLILLDDPEETLLAIKGAVTVDSSAALVALFNAWSGQPYRHQALVA